MAQFVQLWQAGYDVELPPPQLGPLQQPGLHCAVIAAAHAAAGAAHACSTSSRVQLCIW
jgi:hypothetical protein